MVGVGDGKRAWLGGRERRELLQEGEREMRRRRICRQVFAFSTKRRGASGLGEGRTESLDEWMSGRVWSQGKAQRNQLRAGRWAAKGRGGRCTSKIECTRPSMLTGLVWAALHCTGAGAGAGTVETWDSAFICPDAPVKSDLVPSIKLGRRS